MVARHITTESFEREVLHSGRPTLLDFYADWCGPCRAMSPVIDELASDVESHADVVKVDIDKSPELAAQYGVNSIPTFIVLRDGNPTERFVGVQSKQVLAKAVES